MNLVLRLTAERSSLEVAPAGVKPEADEGIELEIHCYPAGAIYGTVLEADGSPAEGVMISVVEAEFRATV